MTWLSRLLPNGRSSLQRATKRRRRIMKLELLENRTLLSNVSVFFTLPGTLTILGDNFNDSFSITEQSTAAGGKVTVASTSLPTTINGSSVPFVSTEAVTSIMVTLPGTTNFDTVSLLGAGKTTPTTVKNVTITGLIGPTATAANLKFTANGVDNNDALTLNTALPPLTAALTANVDNSSFRTLAIYQAGGSQAVVELGNNTIPGPAVVHEGYGNKDSITVDNGNVSGRPRSGRAQGGPVDNPLVGTADSVTVNQTPPPGTWTFTSGSTARPIHQREHRQRRLGQLRCEDLAGQRRWRHDQDQRGHDLHSAQSHCTSRFPAQHRRRLRATGASRSPRGTVTTGMIPSA